MVRGRYKSHSFRKVFVKTPGGKTVVHRRLRKPGHAVCVETGQRLHGIKTLRKTKLGPKSTRTVARAYGGVLSSRAARRKIIGKARAL